MKNCLVMTGGCLDFDFAEKFLAGRSYSLIVAVDAGLEMLQKLQLTPHEIVGDLDTVKPSVLLEYKDNPNIHMEIHKPEKDETDTELALITAEGHGCDSVDMLGALGGRMDHAISNLHLTYQFYKRGMNVCIYDEKNKIYLLGGAKTFHKDALYGKYISFLPMTEVSEGLSLKGFKFPLNKKTVYLGTSLCISNELCGDIGEMELEKGVLICVESHD